MVLLWNTNEFCKMSSQIKIQKENLKKSGETITKYISIKNKLKNIILKSFPSKAKELDDLER